MYHQDHGEYEMWTDAVTRKGSVQTLVRMTRHVTDPAGWMSTTPLPSFWRLTKVAFLSKRTKLKNSGTQHE